MKHIHPFPARMAPEIALSKLSTLKRGQRVLDPMTGSGMVLSTAARSGIESIGVDLDPLAVLISGVASTRVDVSEIYRGLTLLEESARGISDNEIELPWIDQDPETKTFISFWFYEKQILQLRKLAYFLIKKPIKIGQEIINVLITAVSRLIVTKEPKASLARDTAHSRPHRTLSSNDFDIFESLRESVAHVVGALNSPAIRQSSRTYSGDARNMFFLENGEVDAIVTSPPYLNAIDYMRGHRLSLVWFGYSIGGLRTIRSTSIGAERTVGTLLSSRFIDLLRQYNLWEESSTTTLMIQKYFVDLCDQLSESFRVLKVSGFASYVIGNSEIKGRFIPNSTLLTKAAEIAGFDLVSEKIRDIPDSRRYLPISGVGIKSLSKRMRTEHILTFIKP